MLDRLHIKWIKEKPNCASDASVSLGLEKLVGLFALLFIGFISSIWACSMECLWKYLGPQGRTRFLDPQRWTLRDQMRFKKDLRRSLDNLKWSPSDTDLDAILHIINSERTKRSSVLGRWVRLMPFDESFNLHCICSLQINRYLSQPQPNIRQDKQAMRTFK